MNLTRVSDLSSANGHNVPGLLAAPASPRGGAVLIPSYGATKEQLLGIAFALGESGIASLAIDLCGHGENHAAIGPVMHVEAEAAVRYMRRFRRSAAIGVSLGGRLALMTSADCMIAISPAVVAQVSPQGKWMFENFPSPAVREPYSGYVVELLEQLGPVPNHDRPCLLLYAERDIPMILEGAPGLAAGLPGAEVRHVKSHLRPDVGHENAFIRYLPRWFNHTELKFNSEVYEVATRWLAERWTMAQTA